MRMPNLISFVFATFSLLFLQSGPPTFSDPQLADSLQPKEVNGRWGFVDETGKFVIPARYFAVQPFRDGLSMVVTKKPWAPLGQEAGEFRLAEITYIDHAGREIRPPLSVRRASSFSEGLAAVVPDSALRLSGGCAKGGYLDEKGEWAIQPHFDGLTDFSEGLAAVNPSGSCGMGGKWGYIDRDGQLVIPYKFASANQFHYGKACVRDAIGRAEVIDRAGAIIPNEQCP